MTPKEVLLYYGNPYKFADKTGMSHASLYNWMRQGFVPVKSQEKLHELTKGKLIAEFHVNKEKSVRRHVSWEEVK